MARRLLRAGAARGEGRGEGRGEALGVARGEGRGEGVRRGDHGARADGVAGFDGLARRVTVVAVAAGTILRVEEFAARRSLWLDEASVALNIVARDFHGLTRPLDYQQGAPIGWLWLQRAIVIVLGQNAPALRAVPLASGVAAIVLTACLARRWLPAPCAAVATVFVALSPQAIRYSAEVKQYSSDLAVCAALLLLAPLTPAARPAETPDPPRRRWVAWSVTGAVAVWCAHPGVLVLAATALAGVLRALATRDGRGAARMVMASVPWAASFGALWLVSLRGLGRDSFLKSYWAKGLAPRPWRLATLVPWVGHVVAGVARDPGGLAFAGFAAVVVGAGWIALARWDGLAAAWCGAIALAAVGAGAVGAFPLAGRLTLYLLPVIGLGLGAALAPAVGRRGAGTIAPRSVSALAAGVAGAIAVASVAASPVAAALASARHPFSTPDSAGALAAVATRRAPGDRVWVQWPELPVALFYARSDGLRIDGVVDDAAGGDCSGVDPARAAAGGRVWVVAGYRLSRAPVDERSQILARLGAEAKPVDAIDVHGAAAYLFDFSAPGGSGPPAGDGSPAAGGAGPRPVDRLGCLAVAPAPLTPPTGLHRGPLGTGPTV